MWLPFSLYFLAGCVSMSGAMYNNSEEWHEDACTMCRCDAGQVSCQAASCQVKCQHPVYVPGQCCPTCQGLHLFSIYAKSVDKLLIQRQILKYLPMVPCQGLIKSSSENAKCFRRYADMFFRVLGHNPPQLYCTPYEIFQPVFICKWLRFVNLNNFWDLMIKISFIKIY